MAGEKPIVLQYKGGSIDDRTYADAADNVMRSLSEAKDSRGKSKPFNGLTTSKIRGMYGLIMNVYTQINEPADFERHLSDIQYLKVRMAYEAGRDKSNRDHPVTDFLDKTHLMELVSNVKTYDQFMLYCRYAESLVAYFKFYGGRD